MASGLVDELGDLDTAIDLAQRLAGLAERKMTYVKPHRGLRDRLLANTTTGLLETVAFAVEGALRGPADRVPVVRLNSGGHLGRRLPHICFLASGAGRVRGHSLCHRPATSGGPRRPAAASWRARMSRNGDLRGLHYVHSFG